MKGHKRNKLALIHFLSNDKVIINYWHLQKEFETLPPEYLGGRYPERIDTGRGTINIQFYQKLDESNTTNKEQTGATKRTKGSDSKRPQAPPDRIETNG